MTASNGAITIQDYNGEKSTVNVNLQDLDAAGANHGSIAQDLDEIKDGILGVILGQVRETGLTYKYPESSAAVTDQNAVREMKWLVTFRDTTQFLGAANTVPNPGFNKLFSFEIATPDRSLLPANEDEADLTDAAWVTFIAAVEPNIRSPFNRTAVAPTNDIVSVICVGRNL